MQPLILQILDEVRGTWRFRWAALAAAWTFCLVGWGYVFTMPDVYEASARVYVDSQTALGPLLRGLALDPNVESELSIVQKALMSRPQLERHVVVESVDHPIAVAPRKGSSLIFLIAIAIGIARQVEPETRAGFAIVR